MSALRPYCCVVAELDGFTAEEHAEVCRVQPPRTDLAPTETEGGPR